MGRNCAAYLAAAISLLLACGVSAQEPRLQIREAVFDFGTVDEGASVTHDFELLNSGNADLRIERVVPTCGCTVPTLPADVLAPGATAQLQVQFNTSGFNGRVEKHITLFTNDENKAASTLTLRGEIVPLISVTPPYLDFGRVVKGAPAPERKEVTVRIKAGSGAEISQVKAFGKHLVLEDMTGGAKERRFFLSLSPDVPRGELRDRVVIGLKGAEQSSVNLPVFANVSGPLALVPATVSLGIIAGEQEIVRKVRLENYGEAPVALRGATSSDSAVRVSHRTLSDGRRYEIELRVAPGLVKHDLRAEVTLETDLPGEEELTFGVYGVLPPERLPQR